MVLKRLIIFFVLFFSFGVASFADVLKLDSLYKFNDPEELLYETEDLLMDPQARRNYKVYEYQALALEEMGEYDQAIDIYVKLLNARFKRENARYLNAIKSKRRHSLAFRDSDMMIFYYKKIAQIFVEKYKKVNIRTPENEKNLLQKRALTFITAVNRVDQAFAQARLNEMKAHNESLKAYEYNFFFSVNTGIISWQNTMFLENTDGGNRSGVLSTFFGNCTGVGLNWKNKDYTWRIENCFVQGNATGQSVYGNLSYRQSGVSTQGLYGALGVSLHRFSDRLSLDFNFNYLAVSSSYTEPEGTQLKYKDYLRFGASVGTKWRYKRLGVGLYIGKIIENDSSLFQLDTSFSF